MRTLISHDRQRHNAGPCQGSMSGPRVPCGAEFLSLVFSNTVSELLTGEKSPASLLHFSEDPLPKHTALETSPSSCHQRPKYFSAVSPSLLGCKQRAKYLPLPQRSFSVMNSNPLDGSEKLGHDTLMTIIVPSAQSGLKCNNSHHIINFLLIKNVFVLRLC